MICPRCGATNPDGAHYCLACGLGLDAMVAEARRRERDRRIVIWGAIGAVVGGLLVCDTLLVILNAPDVAALLLSTIAAVVPALIYTRIVLRMDRYEREPRRTVLACFGWGALFATFAAGILNAVGYGIFGAAIGPESADALTATFVAPVIEESFKGAALLLLLLVVRDEFDDTLDGLIYGALVGLGFATMENITYFSTTYISDGALGFGVLVAVRTITGMFGHAMWTGLTGAGIGWGRGREGKGIARFIVPILAWWGAIAQHALWNGLISFTNAPLVALGFFVLGFVLVFIIWRVSLRRERAILAQYLAEEVTGGTLTQQEYEVLWNDKARRRVLRDARRRGGRRLRRTQQEFFQAAAELAFRKYHLAAGARPRAGLADAPEDAYRRELTRLRSALAA